MQNAEKKAKKIGGLSAENFYKELFLFYLSRFTGKIAKIIQLGATDFTVLDNVYSRDARRMKREGTLDTYAERNAAHGKRLADRTVFLGDDDALESLNTLAVAFFDLDRYAHGIAHVKRGNVRLHIFFFDFGDDVAHDTS